METKKYVVGLLFNEWFTEVALVRKNRPEWQCGLLNGIGGKVEPGETFEQAMRREFFEEAGLYEVWNHYMTLTSDKTTDPTGIPSEIAFFYAVDNPDLVETKTDEMVSVYKVKELMDGASTVPNLPWVIQMAVTFTKNERAKWFKVIEVQ